MIPHRMKTLIATLAVAGAVCSAQGPYAQKVLADNPAIYLRIGETAGTVAVDSSGNGRNGEYVNVTLGVDGALAEPDKAGRFAGRYVDPFAVPQSAVESFIDTGYVASVTAFTIEAWVKPSGNHPIPGFQQQLIAGISGAAQLLYDSPNAPGRVKVYFYPGVEVVSQMALPLNAWTHVAGVWNPGTGSLRVYLNGQLNGETLRPGAVSMRNPSDTPRAFQAGGFRMPGYGSWYLRQWFQGELDEVAYYESALDEGRIAEHFQAWDDVENVNRPPVARCQAVVVQAGPACSATASIDNGSSDPEGGPLAMMQSPAGPYRLGATPVILTVTDGGGLADTCGAAVTVADQTAPEGPEVTVSPDTLWSPNHKMVAIDVAAAARDNCGAASCRIVSVTSNEPVSAEGDWVISGDLGLQLRSERLGQGSSRVYTITVQCSDGAGNPSSTKSVSVTVPHDKRK